MCFIQPLLVNVEDGFEMYTFLFVPSCGYGLLGGDSMTELGTWV